MASEMQALARVRDPHQTPCDREAIPDEELIREVRHAAGNLVQRMHYLTVLLEDGNATPESIAGLRASLDSLHRLIVRSLDLMRVADLRPVSMPVRDVLQGVALRFGGTAELEPRDAVAARGCEVWVDPFALERAATMLAEALGAHATNGRAETRVTVERDAQSPRLSAVLSLECTAAVQAATDPCDRVHARVTLALACKLLEELGFPTLARREGDAAFVRITFPLLARAQRDGRSLHSPSSSHSSDTIPL